ANIPVSAFVFVQTAVPTNILTTSKHETRCCVGWFSFRAIRGDLEAIVRSADASINVVLQPPAMTVEITDAPHQPVHFLLERRQVHPYVRRKVIEVDQPLETVGSHWSRQVTVVKIAGCNAKHDIIGSLWSLQKFIDVDVRIRN